jgi:hypothetical protein
MISLGKQRCEADNSPPTGSKIKYEESYTSTSPICLEGTVLNELSRRTTSYKNCGFVDNMSTE